MSDSAGGPLAGLMSLPGVSPGSDAVREAYTSLRFHEALRRRIPEASAESRVRGAQASARLDGATLPIDLVRERICGAAPWGSDPVDVTVHAAARVTAATEQVLSQVVAAPAQAMARLHVAAVGGLIPDEQVGRPRPDGVPCDEFASLPAPPARVDLPRITGLLGLVRQVPAPVVAALVHAEIVAVRPFTQGNGLVARAMERAVLKASGADPTGVSVPEMGWAQAGPAYVGALTAYLAGGIGGVEVFVQSALRAQLAGSVVGVQICDAVRAGRLTSPQ